MSKDKSQTSTGGRDATSAIIPGRFALSVGKPDIPTPNGWQWVKLTDVARLESGHTPSRQKPEYWDGGVSWIGIKDATSNHGKVIADTYQHCSQLGIDNSSARVLPANTVCLSRTASVGYVVVMGKPMATSQDFVNWVCSDAIDYRYLASILVAERDSLFQFSRGTTHQTIYYPEVKAFHVLLPPIDQQKCIADIIWSMNDKIELNRQINQTLEQIAQAIFKSWFVDFEPVKAKIKAKAAGRDPERAAMCAISGKSEAELDQLEAQGSANVAGGRTPGATNPDQYQQLAATAALFPNELVESELGLIPVGWVVSEIGKEVTVVGGSTPSTANPDFWDGEFAWVTPKDLSRISEKVLTGSERTITAAGVGKISSGQLPVGTVLLSSRAPIGYLALSMIPVSINQGFIAMICNKRLPNTYALQWATANLDAIKQRGSGTTFAEISKSNFRPMSVLVPCTEVLDSFQQLVKPLYEQITAFVSEVESLATLRDTLLPKLLSGVLSVGECEQQAEACA